MCGLRILLAAVLLLILAACGSNTSNTGNTFPQAVVTGVTPTELAPGGELTITGRNFYAVNGLAGPRIDVCGVTVNGSLVEPHTRNILLPPGSVITAQVSSRVSGTVPQHGFTAGTSDVRITRPDGSTAVLAGAVTCVGPEAEPTPVTAEFTASSLTGVAPATISFDASDSSGAGQLEYSWHFGVDDAQARGVEVSYEYLQPGSYTVTLTVTDETGAAATASREAVINPALQAVIQHGDITGYAPLTVTFDATGSTGTGPLSYAWDFGDNSETSSDPQPEHEYEAGGTYTVTLTVTDAEGDTDATELDLVIPTLNDVQALIIADRISGQAPLTVNFNGRNSSGQGSLEYSWNFGSAGATSSEPEAAFTFTAGGIYSVALTVTDETGRSSTTTQAIAVDTAPASLNLKVMTADLNPDSQVVVTSNNYSTTIRLPAGRLSGLAPGEYTITPEAFTRTDLFDGQTVTSVWVSAPQQITVTEGETREVELSFEPLTGALELAFHDVPSDPPANAWSVTALHTPLDWPANATDPGQLLPGVYRVGVSGVNYLYGNREDMTDWRATYEPVTPSVQLVVNSGNTTAYEVNYNVVTGSVGIHAYLGLPADQPRDPISWVLRDPDNNEVSRSGSRIVPGHYRLHFSPVDYDKIAGPALPDGSEADIYVRYAADPIDVYVSSGIRSVRSARYAAQDALLQVTVEAPAGTSAGLVSIAGPNGEPVASFAESTSGPVQLTVPLGVYQLSFNPPPGYRVAAGSAAEGSFIVDKSRFYGGVENPFHISVKFEELSPG